MQFGLPQDAQEAPAEAPPRPREDTGTGGFSVRSLLFDGPVYPPADSDDAHGEGTHAESVGAGAASPTADSRPDRRLARRHLSDSPRVKPRLRVLRLTDTALRKAALSFVVGVGAGGALRWLATVRSW